MIVRGNAGGSAWRRRSTGRSRNQYQDHNSQSLNRTNLDNYPETTIYSRSTDYTHPAPTYIQSVPTRRSSSSFLDNSRSERSRFSDSGLPNFSGQSMFEQTKPPRNTDRIPGYICALFLFVYLYFLFF